MNASIAVGAVTGLDIEAPHNRLPHDVFLKLRLRVVMNDPPAAVGTRLCSGTAICSSTRSRIARNARAP